MYKENRYVQKGFERNLVRIKLINRHLEKQQPVSGCTYILYKVDIQKSIKTQHFFLNVTLVNVNI